MSELLINSTNLINMMKLIQLNHSKIDLKKYKNNTTFALLFLKTTNRKIQQ